MLFAQVSRKVARVSQASIIRTMLTRRILDAWYGKEPPVDGVYRQSVTWGAEGGEVVRQTLESGKPCLIARFGSVELACVSYYVRWRRNKALQLPYPSSVRRAACNNAGVFPTDDASLDRFSQEYLRAISMTDVLGVWFNRNEHRIVERYCPDARLVHLEALNPVLQEHPWSAELAGKRRTRGAPIRQDHRVAVPNETSAALCQSKDPARVRAQDDRRCAVGSGE